jgi:ribosomal protein S3
MQKNNKTKIFKHNLDNYPKTTKFNVKKDKIGIMKYFPSFSNEWINTIYSFNNNKMINLSTEINNINKIIKSYFGLYFKSHKFIDIDRITLLKKRRFFFKKIFISNVEIKHTNNKVIITLYALNREINLLKKMYWKINKKIYNKLLREFISSYNFILKSTYTILSLYKNKYIYIPSILRKKRYLKSKFEYLNQFITIKNLYLKKTWSILIDHYLTLHINILRKNTLLLSLNKLKFNKLSLLSKLNQILEKIFSKKIEYNIINIKHLQYNPDIFTEIAAIRLKNRKLHSFKVLDKVVSRTNLPIVNTIQERAVAKKWSIIQNKYRDNKVISNLNNTNLKNLLNDRYSTSKSISNQIYNSIKYKNIGGITLLVKGRLTRRNRADRAVQSVTLRGGLKNVDSSFKRLSSILFRGNVNSNVIYSLSTSKRRIGSYAVRGWLAGK